MEAVKAAVLKKREGENIWLYSEKGTTNCKVNKYYKIINIYIYIFLFIEYSFVPDAIQPIINSWLENFDTTNLCV